MLLSGHLMDMEGRVLVYPMEKYHSQMKSVSEARLSQLFPLAIQNQYVSMPLSGHIMDIGGRVLVHQMERYQLNPTYNASW